MLALGSELRDTAERAGVLRAVAFATALRGEAALLKGDLDLAETELRAAADLHHDLESPAGEAHSSAAPRGGAPGARRPGHRANQLLRRALPLARWSLIGLHLMQRIYGNMIDAAPDVDAARAVVDQAESTLVDEDRCSFCSIMFAVPAARACADAGDLDDARRYLTSRRAVRAAVGGNGVAGVAGGDRGPTSRGPSTATPRRSASSRTRRPCSRPPASRWTPSVAGTDRRSVHTGVITAAVAVHSAPERRPRSTRSAILGCSSDGGAASRFATRMKALDSTPSCSAAACSRAR